MVVRKFNYYKFSAFIIILILIIVGIAFLINKINYRSSYDYKLLSIGYSESDVKIIKNKLSNQKIDKLLSMNYDSTIISFINEKYFIFNNLTDYINYYKDNDYDYSKVVSIINSEANIDWLEYERETDTSKKELMLVNRLYGLSSDYEPDDIVDVPVKYAYSGSKVSKSILDDIESLIDDARENGYNFVVSGGYRSYKEQEKLYNTYVNGSGRIEADKVVARKGHSEYQTGLSFDLLPYNVTYDNPLSSEEYLWLHDNAHKYGFIFRFEKEKEYLTLFNSSAWRLRYVGVDAASLMHNEKICLEEYYAYFVRRNENE